MPRTVYPLLYQVNTRIFLQELGARLGRPATLDDIPDDTIADIAGKGFDWVWLLGIWQTGPASRQVSRTVPDLLSFYRHVLPDMREDDITGSPFAVQSYSVHRDFGGDEALARLRRRLRRQGIRLMLDLVPNHTALDHPWVQEHPEFYVHGTEADLARAPHNFCWMKTPNGPRVLAHGRDPYFPGWTDTLQLNYRHPKLRQAMVAQVLAIAERCDGVRCDMAMLLLPDVFIRTWGDTSAPCDGMRPVDSCFWQELIPRVRRQWPDFLFLAEVYWDLEWTLQQQGFDYTYDKRLYDRLRAAEARLVRAHLWAEMDFQRKLARFLENHDEPRAADVFPPTMHRAAAVVTFFVPGMRFLHEGQLEGRKVRASIHLGRRMQEPVDLGLRGFYERLLECLKRPEVRHGEWQLLECRPAWPENSTWENFIAFLWMNQEQRLLVAVNYGHTRGQCYVEIPIAQLRGREVALRDHLGPAYYQRSGDDLLRQGLYLDMPEWGYHGFELTV